MMREKRNLVVPALVVAFFFSACGSVTGPKTGLNVVASVISQTTGSVTFRIGIENTGSETRTLSFSSAQFCEIEVKSLFGKLVWNFAHDAYFATMVWNLEVAPGETAVRELIWDLTGNDQKPVPSGVYKARIVITGGPRDEALSTEIGLTI